MVGLGGRGQLPPRRRHPCPASLIRHRGRRDGVIVPLDASADVIGCQHDNIPWDAWGEYLDDHLGATAIIDRLLHHSHVIVINGPSYREWAHRQETEAPRRDG